MITTLTLNPALDKTAIVEDITLGGLNRVLETMQSPGGKGINVSKGLARLGNTTIALGIIAGDTGAWIAEYLSANHTPHDFVEGVGQTRTNLKVFAKSTETITEFNEKGNPVNQEIMNRVWQKARSYVEKSEFMVYSGSVPAGVSNNIYYELINAFKGRTKTVLDADGILLTQGIEAIPYLVKPNIHELEKLFNRTLAQEKEIIACGRELVDRGIAKVLISMGRDGSILVTESDCYKVAPVKVTVKSTVGAGDSMVAGFVHGLSQGMQDLDALRLSVACAMASMMTEGTETFALETVENVLAKIQIEKVH